MRVRTPVSVIDVACVTGGLSRFQYREENRKIPEIPSTENAHFRAYMPNFGTLFVENKITGEIRTAVLNTADVDFHSVSEDGNTVWWRHEGVSDNPRWADLSDFSWGSARYVNLSLNRESV